VVSFTYFLFISYFLYILFPALSNTRNLSNFRLLSGHFTIEIKAYYNYTLRYTDTSKIYSIFRSNKAVQAEQQYKYYILLLYIIIKLIIHVPTEGTFYPEGGGRIFLRNVTIYYAAIRPRRSP
jgi:hypothetical protein